MSYSKRRRRGFGRILFLFLIVIVAALFYDSNTRLVTEEYEIESSSLPENFDGLKIVQLSDLHNAEFGENNEKLLRKVAAAEPDLIAVTGDLIDGDRADSYVRELMTGLAAIAPVYYVTGNHEWASGWIQELFDLLKECDVTVLRNEYVLLARGGDTIVLAGADDPNGPYDMFTHSQLVSEIREREGERYILMLYHRNDDLAEWEELGVDAVLCGHAHGGVIRLPFTDGLISPEREWFPDITSGLHEFGETDILISRGLGNRSGTIRFWNNPEIVEATLRASEKKEA